MQGLPSCASAGAAASSKIADMIFSIAAAPFGIGTQARTLQVRINWRRDCLAETKPDLAGLCMGDLHVRQRTR